MLKKNDIIEIDIKDISIEGAGIGRHEGLVVFVPKALPEEKVNVKIIKLTKNYAVAKLLDIIVASKDRAEPFCEVFEKCGGCTLQHLSYKGQLEFKRKHVKDCFLRLGGIDIGAVEILPADNLRDYRNKASFPVAMTDGKLKAGFYAPRSHRLVASDCPIQKQAVNDVKEKIIEWARYNGIKAYDEAEGKGTLRHIVARQASNGDLMAGIVVRGQIDEQSLLNALKGVKGLKCAVVNHNEKNTNVILGEKSRVIYGEEYITESYEDLNFRVGFSSFLQINHDQSEKLYKTALEYAQITKKDRVFDLFCGIGTISLLAAKCAKKVIGIEYSENAVKDAKINAELNGMDNAKFIAGDAGEKIDEAVSLYGRPDIIILDPPRKGCDSSLIDKITAVSPQKIVYVSCDPSTLARDVSLFCEKGYELKKIKAVDMFVHTTHVETVVLMSRV